MSNLTIDPMVAINDVLPSKAPTRCHKQLKCFEGIGMPAT